MDMFRKKQSILNSGEKNNMYGKSPPVGSGSGIGCWYKKNYFRSLKELTFFIKEIEQKNLIWRTAQNKNLRIKYIDQKGVNRTYVADFLINENILVEVKPKPLWNVKSVQIKAEAGRKFCSNLGWEYKLIDIEVDKDILREKLVSGEINLQTKYEQRVKNFLKI